MSSVAAEGGFSFKTTVKTAMRSRLSERKTQNLMTIVSAAIALDAFDYAQVSHSLNPYQPGGRFEFRLGHRKSIQIILVHFFCRWLIRDLSVMDLFCKIALFICLLIRIAQCFLCSPPLLCGKNHSKVQEK